MSDGRAKAIVQDELRGRSDASLVRQELRIIETPEGEPVGFLGHGAGLPGTALQVYTARPRIGARREVHS